MIGLTGGISSGKSSVASRLCEETGYNLVSADKIAAELLGVPGAPLDSLRQLIGEHFFSSDGALNRAVFRQALFADVHFREKVDNLLHPLIRIDINEKADIIEEETSTFVIAEVPLLYEAGWQDEFSEIVVVYAPRSECLKRLMARDSLSLVEAEKAFTAQDPIEGKVVRADYVIDNSGTWFDTLVQIKRLGKILLAKSP